MVATRPQRTGHVVVVGASMAGLLAARVLSETFAQVTVVDRDTLPDDPIARRGVPQGRHAHGLLARAAGGSATLYRHLLTLRGAEHPEGREALARAVAAAYGVDASGLAAPFAERAETTDDEARSRARFAAYLDALERLIVAVDELPTT